MSRSRARRGSLSRRRSPRQFGSSSTSSRCSTTAARRRSTGSRGACARTRLDRRRSGSVISTPVPGVDRMEAWGQALQSLASRAGTRVSWYEIALLPQPEASGQPAPRGLSDHGDVRARHRVRAEAGRRRTAGRLADGPRAGERTARSGRPGSSALYREDVASYLDGIALAADDERSSSEAAAAGPARRSRRHRRRRRACPSTSADSIVSTSLARLGGRD